MNEIKVEVIYLNKNAKFRAKVTLPKGATVQDAIYKCEVLTKHSEINLKNFGVGVYSRIAKLSSSLKSNDRVEIYPPLIKKK